MYLTQLLHKALREYPNDEAVVFGERRQTWAQLTDRVARLAGVLQTLGMGPDDRVGILGLNSDRYMETVFAALWGGGVFNTVNIRWSAPEIAYSLDDCDTRILFVDDEFASMLGAIRERSSALQKVVYMGDRTAPEGTEDLRDLISGASPVADAGRCDRDLAGILYTGGTTGKPKGVMLSHGNLYLSALSTVIPACRKDRIVGLHSAPFFHVAGIGLLLQLSIRGGTNIILPRFEPLPVIEAIGREKVEETFLVPTMLRAVLDHPEFDSHDTSSLRCFIYGASPMDSALLKRAMKKLPNADFLQMYGMTELSPTVTMLHPEIHSDPARHHKLMSAGCPTHIAEIRIVDPMDNEVPRGQVGEICARGPMVMQGYWNKESQTRDAIREGWMHTGDAGYMDDDGYVFLVDRIKDMIVTGGENVYSVEVEDVLLQYPQVSQCAVIGVPDEKWGERVHAVLILREGEELDEADLTTFCKEHIAGYKCPRSYEVRDQLPMSGAGKLLKFKLKEEHWKEKGRNIG
ncbi:Acyl-CoA synthetase (AMP-forming)/AMP-acid ligase II [Marinobacter daqiaonensis]|uniref:Acyl-CoA synthetase (AMP-forming)/AMP-acid ligase II n=1 Tax=Marinobacter daqiaonensis TaxID=650891 RepID=A0A1I6IP79_9GAMM|nr:long-chain-fatty-acid--CoA ligase [Marinobacter daqiaonensis]SFR68555.1 Acyl-CoA synthetase (AMP-forming)/AMP-acid ligase II [Marinobacter daqiaonensis]